MLKKLSRLFKSPASHSGNPMQVDAAVAILLVEVMHADHEADADERKMVIELLRQHFDLTAEQAEQIYTDADAKVRHVVSLQEYTRFLNQSLEYSSRVVLIEHLWQVVYADGRIDKYEEHLVRRIADLLYVKHQDFVRSKHRAAEQQ